MNKCAVLYVMYLTPKKKRNWIRAYVFRSLEEAKEIESKMIHASWIIFDIEVY